MGQFTLDIAGGRTVLPNVFCVEGADYLFRKAFVNGAAVQFQIGLTALNISCDRTRRPDFIKSQNRTDDERMTLSWWKLDADSTYLRITGNTGEERAPSHEGGIANAHADGVHGRVMGYTRKNISFAVDDSKGIVQVRSAWASFANHADWEAIPDSDGAIPGWWYKDDMLSPDSHGWPWNTPHVPAGSTDARISGYATPVPVDPEAWEPPFYYTLACNTNGVTIGDDWFCWIAGLKLEITEVAAGSITVKDPSGSLDYDHPYYFWVRPDTLTAREMDGNAWKRTSLPLGAAFVCVDEKLVAASRFVGDLVLFPGQNISVMYSCLMSELIDGVDLVY